MIITAILLVVVGVSLMVAAFSDVEARWSFTALISGMVMLVGSIVSIGFAASAYESSQRVQCESVHGVYIDGDCYKGNLVKINA